MKKINFSKVNVKSLWNKTKVFFYNHCIVYFKEYPFLFYFMITTLCNTLLLRIITVGNFLYFKPLLADLAMLFIFSSFMFLFKTDNKKKKYLVVLSFVTAIICIIHSIYYTYYDSFASISLLATSTFVVDVGDAVVEQVLKISDLLYLWQPIFMYSCYVRDKKKRNSMISLEKKIISLETILNRPPIILVGRTTENFIKLLKEIYNGN